jgi:hypothetical protein
LKNIEVGPNGMIRFVGEAPPTTPEPITIQTTARAGGGAKRRRRGGRRRRPRSGSHPPGETQPENTPSSTGDGA